MYSRLQRSYQIQSRSSHDKKQECEMLKYEGSAITGQKPSTTLASDKTKGGRRHRQVQMTHEKGKKI